MASRINHHERARRAFAAGAYADAAESAELALKRARGDAVLLYILGTSRTNLGDPDRGLEPLTQAAALAPDNPDILTALANCHRLLDHVEDAHEACDRALATRPEFEPAIALKCQLLRTTGHAADALAFIEPHHTANPDRAALACEFADACLALDDAERGIAALEPIAPQATASDPRRRTPLARSVLYKLANLLDRVGRHDDAFAAASEANRGRDTRMLTADRVRRRWTRDAIRALPQSSERGVTPVLVVGMPRSGTTLTERLIAAHPHAAGAGETKLLPGTDRALADLGRPPTQAWMNANARRVLDRLSADDATHAIDKLPGNIANLGLASRLLPDARVIHCTRDPRDVCLSCFMQDFPDSMGFTTDLAACARKHREQQAMLAHWRDTLDMPILDLSYERLTRAPEQTARELLDFVGLAWDEGVLRFHERAGHVRTASWNQVTRPINARRIGRWKKYERHLAPALKVLSDQCDGTDGYHGPP